MYRNCTIQVKRHLTIKHNFICFTDNTSLHRIVKGDIDFRKFPLDDEIVGGTNYNYFIQIVAQ